MTGTTEDREGSPWARWASAGCLAVAVAVVWAAAAAIVPFALPADDDFLRAGRWGFGHTGLSWADYVFRFVYLRWQGRWVSCGIEAAVLPAVDVTRHYPLLVAGLIAVDIGGLAVVCRWMTRRGPWRLSLALTMTLAAMLWAGLPSTAEGLYWVTGAVENTTSLAVAGVLLVVVAATPATAGWPRLVGLAAAAAIVCGFHELFDGAVVLLLAIGWIAAVKSQTGTGRVWRAATVGAAMGWVIVVVAPGNVHRLVQGGTGHARQPVYDLLLAARLLGRWGHWWVLDVKLLAASVWVAVSPSLERTRVPWPTARRFAWRWVLPGGGVAVVAIGFALPCYAFGDGVPMRTLSGNHVVFVVAWLATVYASTRHLDRLPDGRRHSWIACASVVTLATTLVSTGNLRWARSDLAGRIQAWHAASDQRYAALRRAAAVRTDKVDMVPLPSAIPHTVLSGEVSADPADWRNVGQASYFGVGRVAVATDRGR